MHELAGMDIKAKREVVLAKLHANRELHAKIVAEARTGYVEKARKALLERLEQLKEGKVVALSFHLAPPVDQTSVYDTAIQTLELSQDEFIELTPDQVRKLYMDKWDWSDHFLSSNAQYSSTAALVRDRS